MRGTRSCAPVPPHRRAAFLVNVSASCQGSSVVPGPYRGLVRNLLLGGRTPRASGLSNGH